MSRKRKGAPIRSEGVDIKRALIAEAMRARITEHHMADSLAREAAANAYRDEVAALLEGRNRRRAAAQLDEEEVGHDA